MIGDMVTGTVSPEVVRIFSCTLSPVVLADSLLDDSSHLVSRLATVDEDVDIPQCDSTLEVKSLLRNPIRLVLDVLLFAMSHISVYLLVSLVYMVGLPTSHYTDGILLRYERKLQQSSPDKEKFTIFGRLIAGEILCT